MMWRSSPGYYESDEAVIQIGTNAIPTLLRLLRARDSALKVKAIQLLQYQHVIAVEHIPARLWNEVAVWGFSALGTNAQRAVPALIEIAKGDISSSSRKCAIACLDSTGPAAKEAVPYLLQWATNADYEVRTYAKSALLKIAPEAAAKAEITSVP
jgi:HEAT repeat protein